MCLSQKQRQAKSSNAWQLTQTERQCVKAHVAVYTRERKSTLNDRNLSQSAEASIVAEVLIMVDVKTTATMYRRTCGANGGNRIHNRQNKGGFLNWKKKASKAPKANFHSP